MKSQTILNLVMLAALAWLIYRTEQPPKDVTYFKQVFKESHKRSDSLSTQINTVKHEITKDSTIIINSERRYRDSLRAIVNPR